MRAFGSRSPSRSDRKASLKPRQRVLAVLRAAARAGGKQAAPDENDARSESQEWRGADSPQPAASPKPAEPSQAKSAASEAGAAEVALAHRKRRRRKRTAEEKEAALRRKHGEQKSSLAPAASAAEDDVPSRACGTDAKAPGFSWQTPAADPRRQQVGVVEETEQDVHACGERQAHMHGASDRRLRKRRPKKINYVSGSVGAKEEDDAEEGWSSQGIEDDKFAKKTKRCRIRRVECEDANEAAQPARTNSDLDSDTADNGEGGQEHRGEESQRSQSRSAKHGETSRKDSARKDDRRTTSIAEASTKDRKGKSYRHSVSNETPFQAMIRDIYSRKNPAKLADVDELLAKYAGAEEELYESICEKYGEEPRCSGGTSSRAQPTSFTATRGFARKASAPPPPPALTDVLVVAPNGHSQHEEGGWPFLEEFSMNSSDSGCATDGSDTPAACSDVAGAWHTLQLHTQIAATAAGVPTHTGAQQARAADAVPAHDRVTTSFGAGIFGAPPKVPPPPAGPPPASSQGPHFSGVVQLSTFLGHWRDTMGNEVHVDWSRQASRHGQLDVVLSKPGNSRGPIRLNVKAKGSGQFSCGHYDLDVQKSSADRIVWLDSRSRGKASVWQRPDAARLS